MFQCEAHILNLPKADFDKNYSLFISEAASLFIAPKAHLSLGSYNKYKKVIGYILVSVLTIFSENFCSRRKNCGIHIKKL